MLWLHRAQWAARFGGRSLLGALRGPFTHSKYDIRAGYFHRSANLHFDDTANEDRYQREVYERARDLMHAGLNEKSAEKFQAYLSLQTSTWPDERSEAMRFLARVALWISEPGGATAGSVRAGAQT